MDVERWRGPGHCAAFSHSMVWLLVRRNLEETRFQGQVGIFSLKSCRNSSKKDSGAAGRAAGGAAGMHSDGWAWAHSEGVVCMARESQEWRGPRGPVEPQHSGWGGERGTRGSPE